METKINVLPDSQIHASGLKILKENLGVVGTLKFFEQFDNGGTGDYTKEKYMLEDKTLTEEEMLKLFHGR